MPGYRIVERNNRLAVHGLFDTMNSAQYHLENNIPVYVERGYFSDKTLRAEDFVIEEWKRK